MKSISTIIPASDYGKYGMLDHFKARAPVIDQKVSVSLNHVTTLHTLKTLDDIPKHKKLPC